ncbi:hypothetical protein [Paenarthrobacter sp. RAF54_2]|uniref:hypothetical protein n=1 Tax=Paenarthrobacter sp. RAF54_2 TaxID=3233061 RepID=UPI003F9E9A0C
MSPVTVMEVQRSSEQAGPLPGVGVGVGVGVDAGDAGAVAALLCSRESFSAITPQELKDMASTEAANRAPVRRELLRRL